MNKKRKAYQYGLWGETLAIAFLRLKGYRIIGRRVRNVAGEIDLIARRRKLLAFIEVKTRANSHSLDVLTPHQQKRIIRAASLFIAKHPHYAQIDMRFDLIVIRPFRLPEHICNAW